MKLGRKKAEEKQDTAPDVSNESSIAAILRGLQSSEKKKYYIHTSGAALIWDQPDGSKAGEKIWDDVEDIESSKSLELKVTLDSVLNSFLCSNLYAR
jgi:hypothetical protein